MATAATVTATAMADDHYRVSGVVIMPSATFRAHTPRNVTACYLCMAMEATITHIPPMQTLTSNRNITMRGISILGNATTERISQTPSNLEICARCSSKSVQQIAN